MPWRPDRPYCTYCRRPYCFRSEPDGLPPDLQERIKARSFYWATCPGGQAREKEITGLCWDDIAQYATTVPTIERPRP